MYYNKIPNIDTDIQINVEIFVYVKNIYISLPCALRKSESHESPISTRKLTTIVPRSWFLNIFHNRNQSFQGKYWISG
jgi:hypothetical protein